LHININDNPPRRMHTMNSMQHTTSIISAIPVETNIQIPLSISPLNAGTSVTNPIANFQSSNLNAQPFNNNGNNTQTQTTRESSVPTSSSSATSRQSAPNHPANHMPRMPRLISNAFPMPYPPPPPPLPPLLPNISTLNSYDQYLPCNSVHFYNLSNGASNSSVLQSIPIISPFQQTSRRRHPAGNPLQRDQQPQSQPQQQQQPTQQHSTTQNAATPTEPRQTADINRLLNNSISGALHNAIHNAIHTASSSGQHPDNDSVSHIRVNIGSLPNNGISITTISTTDNTPTHSTSSTPVFLSPGSSASLNNENRQQPTHGSANMMNIFDQLFSARSTQSHQAPSQTQMSNSMASAQNIIREAISLMNSSNSNDQRLNQPLGEYFRSMDSSEDADSSDETMTSTSTSSIVGGLFSSMTFGDMINLATGVNRHMIFERSRMPLREHISSQFLENNQLNEDNLNSLTNRIYDDIFVNENLFTIDFDQFELTNERVDLKKSFEGLIKHHIKVMLNHVFDTSFDETQSDANSTAQPTRSAESTWTSGLLNKFFNLIEELIALCRATIKDADNVFTQTVTSKLSQAIMSQNIINNPFFSNILNNFIRMNIRQMVEHARRSHQDIETFIIMKESKAKESASNINDNVVQARSSIAEENFYAPINNKAESTSKVASSMESNQVSIKKDANNTARKSSPIRSSLISSELVHSLPTEWIDTVENDIKNQNSFSHNIAFSDAYCAGMPAKRRKIYATAEQSLPECLFKSIFNKTIRQVQLKSDPNYEKILESTVPTPGLIKSFDNEFDTIINERLRTDKDFKQIKEDEEAVDDNTDDQVNKNKKNRFPNLKKRFR
jgi:hypothetical protein